MRKALLSFILLSAVAGCDGDADVTTPSDEDACFPVGDNFDVGRDQRLLGDIRAAGLACGEGSTRELRLTLLDQGQALLTPGIYSCELSAFQAEQESPEVIPGCSGPFSTEHPRYQEFKDTLCAPELDLLQAPSILLSGSVGLQGPGDGASSPTLEPAHRPGLVACGQSCEVDADCQGTANPLCVNSVCSAGEDAMTPDALCAQSVGGACAGVLETGAGVSTLFCAESCADEECLLSPSEFGCENDAQCQQPATCQPIAGPGFEDFQHCSQDIAPTVAETLTWRDPSEGGAITLAMVMDDSGSLQGRGLTEGDSLLIPDRASDPNGHRLAAAKTALLGLGNSELAETDRLSVSLWAFRGDTTDGVRSLTGGVDGEPADLSSDGPLLDGFLNLIQDNLAGRSNIYQAIEVVAADMEAAARPGRRVILLFTDGPDDSITGSDRDDVLASEQAARERALAAAADAGAEVHIIHLDAAIGPEGLALLDLDLANPIQAPRDSDGRTGPLAVFDSIACSTGGAYWYVQDPQVLYDTFINVVSQLEGFWATSLQLPEVDGDAPAFLSAEVSVETSNGESKTTDFGRFSGLSNNGQTADSRPVIFP